MRAGIFTSSTAMLVGPLYNQTRLCSGFRTALIVLQTELNAWFHKSEKVFKVLQMKNFRTSNFMIPKSKTSVTVLKCEISACLQNSPRRYCDEHFLKLVLNCCVTGPELLRAMLIYIGAQQFRTRNAAIQDQL